MYLFSIQLVFETFLILRRILRDTVINVEMFQVKYPLFLSDLMELEISGRIFDKSSNIKFHPSPSSGSRVIPCGQTDMTKLIVAFRNFANAPTIG